MNIENDTEFYKANLVLCVSDISEDPDPADYPLSNEIGNIKAGRIGYTWYNLDMRTILGNDLYDKFDYFTLRLCAVQYNASSAYIVNTSDLNVYFQMSGPSFYTSTYNVATRKKTSNAILGVATLVQGSTATISYTNMFNTTFQKQPTIDFTINLYRSATDVPVSSNGTGLYPLINYYFNIIPVEYAISDKYPQVY